MAFWDDAKNKVMQAIRPRQQEDNQVVSNRADGGFSGYVPKMNRPQQDVQATGYQQARPAGVENMVPTGVDPSVMQQFQPVGGQTGQMPPVQGQPQQPNFGAGYQQPMGGPQTMGAAQPAGAPQAMGAQPMGPQQMGGPQAMGQGQPRPQAHFQPQPQQPTRPGFGQPAFQQNQPVQQPMGQPQQFTNRQGNFNQQPQQQFTARQYPPQPQQPQQGDGHTFVFPGESYVVDGNAYKLVFRVAQITGVPSCFRVIEFMYNNEAVIVNAEQITDLVEADRCMDLIFGAACAMKQRLMRVSGKQIYLITPPQVYVAPFEPLRRAGMADIERRWPGALQANMQPQSQQAQPYVNNVQPMRQASPQQTAYQQPVNQQMAWQQPMAANQGQPTAQQRPMAQGRQDDFAGGFGRRAARNNMHTNGYTDYGGFGMKTR